MGDLAGPPSLGNALAGRFMLEERLGSGGMGVVYRARDRQLGIDVALKILQGAALGDQRQLTREFRVARDIFHPNLVRLYDLVIRPDAAFFTMELLRGTPLRIWVRGSAAAPERSGTPGRVDLDEKALDRLREILPGVVAGLEALHQRRVVHRDVKPENVFVCGRRPVLLDFGVAKTIPQTEQTSATVSGTPVYIAPEIFDGHPPSPATDAFALGTMLYELLTGDLPFTGAFLAMVQNKQEGRWPPLHTEGEDDARDLIDVTTALLAARAEARPALRSVLSGPPPRTLRAPPPLVGRAAELRRLHETLQRCRAERRPHRVDVTGTSGMGKSRLVQAFLDELPPEILVLAGECHVQEDIPYKGLDGVVAGLARALAGQRAHRPDLERLSSAFPGLLGEAAPSPHDTLPSRQEVISAFRRLVAHATSDAAAAVIFIDDAHWGTGDAAAFLEALHAPLLDAPLLLIFAYRDEGEPSPLLAGLKELPATRRLALGALGPNDASTLLQWAAPTDGALRVPRLALERLGTTPYAVTEVAQWTSDLDEVPSDPLGALVRHRLARLGPPARRLAEVVALAGLPIRRDLLIRAAGVDAPTGAQQIEALCAARLLRRHRSANTVAVYHDRVREAVLNDIDDVQRVALHEAIAQATAALDGSAALLATHLRAARRPADAVAPAIRAAREAMDNLSYQRAVRLYRLALETATAVGQSTNELRRDLAEALAASGAVREAIDVFLELSRARNAPLRLLQRAAELLLGGGWLHEGRATLDELRRRVGLGPMRSRLTRFVLLLIWRARVRFRGLEVEPLPPSQRGALAAKAQALGTQASVFTFYEPGGSAPPQFLYHALRVGEPAQLLRAISLEYTNYGLLRPHGSWTRRLEAKAKAIASRLDDSRAVAFHQLALGYVAFVRGDMTGALELFEAARRRYAELRASGWAYNMTRVHVIFCLSAVDTLNATVYRAEPFYQELIETRDLGIRAYYESHCGYLVRLGKDDPEGATRALLEADASVAARSFKHAIVVGHATVALYRGDPRAALKRLSEAFWTRIESELVQMARILRRWCTGLTLLACETDPKRVSRIATAIEREDAPWAAGMAPSLRSGLAERRGDLAAAKSLAEEAVSRFEAAHLTLYALPARLRAAELSGDRDVIGACLETMVASGVRRPDRWARCLAPWVRAAQAGGLRGERQ